MLQLPSSSSAFVADVDRYFDSSHRGWCFQTWGFLHSICDTFPDSPTQEEQNTMRTLLEKVALTLPCSMCSKHLQGWMAKFPVDCSTGLNLSKWMVNIHNQVNQDLGRPVLSFEDAMAEQRWIRSIKWSTVLSDLRENGKFSHGWRFADRAAPPHSEFFKSRTPTPTSTSVRKAGAARTATITTTTTTTSPVAKKPVSYTMPIVALLIALCAVGLIWCLATTSGRRHKTKNPNAFVDGDDVELEDEPDDRDIYVPFYQLGN